MDALVAMLAHDRDGPECVVVYPSQSVTQTERCWSTFNKDLWAVVWDIRQFRHYIGSAAFAITTDQKPQLCIGSMSIDKNPTGKRARWIHYIIPDQMGLLNT